MNMISGVNEAMLFWIGLVLTGIISIIGMIGNVFTLFIVYHSDLWKMIFYKLIFILACFDIMTILSIEGMSIYYYVHSTIHHSEMILLLRLIGLCGSVYVTAVISFERYLAICHAQLLWRRKLWVYILLVFVMVVINITVPIVAYSFASVSYCKRKGDYMTLGGSYYQNYNKQTQYCKINPLYSEDPIHE